MTMNVKTQVLHTRNCSWHGVQNHNQNRPSLLVRYFLFSLILFSCQWDSDPQQTQPPRVKAKKDLKLAYDTIATYSGTRRLGVVSSFRRFEQDQIYLGMCCVCAIDQRFCITLGLFLLWGKMSSPSKMWCLKTSNLMRCLWTGVMGLRVWSQWNSYQVCENMEYADLKLWQS